MDQDLLKWITNHYACMALNPATLEHARYRVRELKDCPTKLFVDLPNLVKQRIEELKNEKKEQLPPEDGKT